MEATRTSFNNTDVLRLVDSTKSSSANRINMRSVNRTSTKRAWLCLLVINLFAASTTNAAKAEANWAYIGGDRESSASINLNSYNRLPTGIVTYAIKRKMRNPFNGSTFEINQSMGIDCLTKENVNVQNGERTPITQTSISEELKYCPGDHCRPSVVAYLNFCEANR